MADFQTCADAREVAEHLIALGLERVSFYSDAPADFPFDKVTRVEAGSSWRLGGPSSVQLLAPDGDLVFSVSVEFESRDANGCGVHMFDRDRLRELALKLPPAGRAAFADLLEEQVLKGLAERTSEIRESLRTQADSEDCVRGLIAYAREVAI